MADTRGPFGDLQWTSKQPIFTRLTRLTYIFPVDNSCLISLGHQFHGAVEMLPRLRGQVQRLVRRLLFQAPSRFVCSQFGVTPVAVIHLVRFLDRIEVAYDVGRTKRFARLTT